MPPITVMVKPVSGACNMRCRYCFYTDEMQNRQIAVYPRMSEELLETLVKRVMQYASSSATFLFQGGEPTLIGLPFFQKLIDLQRKYQKAGLQVFNAVQTNGYALSDEMIAFFAREKFLVGVSLDGTDFLHDLLRMDADGKPTAAVVRHTIERLRAAGANVNILCVVNREVAKHPREVFEALSDYEYLQFIPCLSALDGTEKDFDLRCDDYLVFLKETFDFYERAFQNGKPVSVRNFDNWVAMLMGMPPENCAMFGRCGPSLVVESDGSCYPCDFYALDEWRLGNITENSFEEMLHSDLEMNFLKESIPVPEKCRSCRWYPLCRNGCKRERLSDTGLTRWCEAHASFFDFAYPRMKQMAEQLKRGIR